MGKIRRGKRAGKQLRKREKREETIPLRGIFNLSNKNLTKIEISVLNKGLKFAPTNSVDKFGMYIDLQRFKRKLSLKKYFLKQPAERGILQNCTSMVHTNLKNKSKFFPRHMISDEIKVFEKLVMGDIERMSTKINHHNLTKEENLALKNLQKDPSIVIKPADKGGGIVILSKELYQEEVMRILNDDHTYGKLKSDPVKDIRHKMEPLLQEGLDKGILNMAEFEYLSMKFTRTPHFYVLPKMHKNPVKPPGRPIVAGIDSITSHLSEYVDTILQPIVCTIPSHLKDTLSMLQTLKSLVWQEGDIMVTCDVNSLYNNIPHELGLIKLEEEIIKSNLLGKDQISFVLDSVR
uniref:Reverse transcriptase domain-containing protein n=1 Tax=Leptobrachium leishanense TaxID=445787 RepID=A0A8C5MP67_9ANUR